MTAAAYRDRFEILHEIGEGAFARVYAAREKASGKKVALKVLKETLRQDPEIVERFRREVFAVASISSPHVVAMHDFGLSGDQVYIAMEFVDGPSLRALLDERTLSVDEIHLVAGQIAQALAAAHRQGIVHRDLKPENVMLVENAGGARQVKVLDFGLAKLAELERNLQLEPISRSGSCFGTPPYIAPELIIGRPFDRTVDLFALGVIVYEMISGFLPWDSADVRVLLRAVVQQPPPRLPPHPTLGRLAELDAFVQRALEKESTKRFPDAATFFRELELALFGAPRPARPGVLVPPDYAAFASVWAASLALKPSEERTDVDVDPTEKNVLTPRGTARRRSSGWHDTLSTEELTAPPDELPTTVRAHAPKAALLPRLDEVPHEPTHVITRAPRLGVGTLSIVVALVVLAATVGYFVGLHSK